MVLFQLRMRLRAQYPIESRQNRIISYLTVLFRMVDCCLTTARNMKSAKLMSSPIHRIFQANRSHNWNLRTMLMIIIMQCAILISFAVSEYGFWLTYSNYMRDNTSMMRLDNIKHHTTTLTYIRPGKVSADRAQGTYMSLIMVALKRYLSSSDPARTTIKEVGPKMLHVMWVFMTCELTKQVQRSASMTRKTISIKKGVDEPVINSLVIAVQRMLLDDAYILFISNYKPTLYNQVSGYYQQMDDTSQDIALKAFKVILVGMQSVGKSSILCQLVSSQFPSAYQATVGIDYHTYAAVVNNKSYSLQIWDTAGQEKFRSLTSTYFKNCNGCICVYDLSQKQSIDKCDYYLTKASQQKIPELCTFLVGNKSDLIPTEQLQKSETLNTAQEKAEKYGIKHRVVSAKEGKGITDLFNDLAKCLSEHYHSNEQQTNIQLLPKLRIMENRENCKC